MNTLDQGGNTFGGLSRTFCEKTDFIGNDCKSSPMLTGHSRLNSGVKCKQVCLIRNIFDDTHNLTDFVGAFTEALDFLRGFLDVLTNDHHTINRLANGLLTTVSAAQCLLRHFSTQLGITGNVLNEDGQRFYSLGGLRNLSHLGLRGLSQFSRTIKDAPGRICHLHSRCLYTSYNFSKLFNHVVE